MIESETQEYAINIGDVVTLNSEPCLRMTVDGIAPGDHHTRTVICVWFNGGVPVRENFNVKSLKVVTIK